MTSRRDGVGRWWPGIHSLPLRVMAFLMLALLPLGLLTFWQTRTLTDVAASRTQLSLIALTELAVKGETRIIERALGAAQVLADQIPILTDDPEECREAMRTVVNPGEGAMPLDAVFSFAAYIPMDGVSTCNSANRTVDLTEHPSVQSILTSPRVGILPEMNPLISREPVAFVFVPVFSGARFDGYVTLSLPLRKIVSQTERTPGDVPIDLTIRSAEGPVILSRQGGVLQDVVNDNLPEGVSLLSNEGTTPATFTAPDPATGESHFYVALPMISGVATAVASWPAPTDVFGLGASSFAPAILPGLMLLGSLLVAYFSVHRLVVRHIQNLRHQMRRFAFDREVPSLPGDISTPTEVRDLEVTFQQMALDLLDDEAKMEDSLREKNVLLKEVHHRVKNNLQMISSIMNMQIRAAEAAETKVVVRRLQDRILGLSLVHRYLYEAHQLEKTNMRALLTDLLDGIFESYGPRTAHVSVTRDLDPISLVPDQAVPLCLLTSEASTNALNHVRDFGDTDQSIVISLKDMGNGRVRFSCCNTLGDARTDWDEPRGLGLQLMRGFAQQLGGELKTERSDTEHRVTVEFAATEQLPDTLDY